MMLPENPLNQKFQPIQPEAASYIIEFNRLFDTSEDSDKFYREVSNSLKQPTINITVNRDEQIISDNRNKFNLHFSINFIARGGREYDDTHEIIKLCINQIHNKYQNKGVNSSHTNQTYNQDRIPSTVEGGPRKSQKTKINLGKQLTDPSFLTIAAFLIFIIAGIYSVNHYTRQNNSNSQPAATQGREPARAR